MPRLLVTAMVASGLLVASALLQPGFAAQPAQTQESSIGPVLADPEGMTLYTFDKDTADTSACTEKCAENWPPLIAGDADQSEGDYTVVTRPDGTKQWAFKGKPLYKWSKDAAPGDTTGEGVNNVWHAARP